MNRFRKQDRLLDQCDFDRVFDEGQYASDPWLVVKGVRNGLEQTRLGLSVSRRVGNAVVRNRWKRLIREAFRLQRDQLPVGLDLVVRPRKGASPNFIDIRKALVRLTRIVHKRLRQSRETKR